MRYMSCFNLTRRFRCNSSSRCGYRAPLTKKQAMEPSRQTRSSYGPPYPLRRRANAKSSMLQENKRDAACMTLCAHTSCNTYSDRHVLGCLLLCAPVFALLCCAVLCSARGSTTTYILIHTTAVLLLLYTGTALPPAKFAHKQAWIGITDRCSKVDSPTL